MERFLGKSLGLMGSDEIQAAQLDMYHTSWTDMMSMFMWKVWRVPADESKAQGAALFWEAFPKFLELHEKVLAERTASGPFYSGSKVREALPRRNKSVRWLIEDTARSPRWSICTPSPGSTVSSPTFCPARLERSLKPSSPSFGDCGREFGMSSQFRSIF